jgi:hypothetical protein
VRRPPRSEPTTTQPFLAYRRVSRRGERVRRRCPRGYEEGLATAFARKNGYILLAVEPPLAAMGSNALNRGALLSAWHDGQAVFSTSDFPYSAIKERQFNYVRGRRVGCNTSDLELLNDSARDA